MGPTLLESPYNFKSELVFSLRLITFAIASAFPYSTRRAFFHS